MILLTILWLRSPFHFQILPQIYQNQSPHHPNVSPSLSPFRLLIFTLFLLISPLSLSLPSPCRTKTFRSQVSLFLFSSIAWPLHLQDLSMLTLIEGPNQDGEGPACRATFVVLFLPTVKSDALWVLGAPLAWCALTAMTLAFKDTPIVVL